MLYVIPSAASGAAAAMVSRSFWSGDRCSLGSDAKYAWTLFGFSMTRLSCSVVRASWHAFDSSSDRMNPTSLP